MKKIFIFIFCLCCIFSRGRALDPTTPLILSQQMLDYVLQGANQAENVTNALQFIAQMKASTEKAKEYVEMFKKASFQVDRVREILYSIQAINNLVTNCYSICNTMMSNPSTFDYYYTLSTISYLTGVLEEGNAELTRLKDLISLSGTDIDKLNSIKESRYMIAASVWKTEELKTIIRILMGENLVLKGLVANDMMPPVDRLKTTITPLPAIPLSTQMDMLLGDENVINGVVMGKKTVISNPETSVSSADMAKEMKKNLPIKEIVWLFYAISAFAGLLGAWKVYSTAQYNQGADLGKQIGIWVGATGTILVLGVLIEYVFG